MGAFVRASVSSFTGKILRQREVRDFRLFDLHYESQAYVPPHRHESTYLGCVVEGSFRVNFSRTEERTYTEGAVLFHPCGESHANRFSAGRNRVLCIEFTESSAKRLSTIGLDFTRRAERSSGPAMLLSRRLFLQLRRKHPSALLAIEGLVLELNAELLSGEAEKSAARRSPLTESAAEWLQKNSHAPVSLQNIAAALGVRPDHLAKRFRRAHGCTVGEYVRRLRMEAACKMLVTTAMPIAQVALDCGQLEKPTRTRSRKRPRCWPSFLSRPRR